MRLLASTLSFGIGVVTIARGHPHLKKDPRHTGATPTLEYIDEADVTADRDPSLSNVSDETAIAVHRVHGHGGTARPSTRILADPLSASEQDSAGIVQKIDGGLGIPAPEDIQLGRLTLGQQAGLPQSEGQSRERSLPPVIRPAEELYW